MLRILILIVALTAGGAAAWLAVSTRPRPQTIVQAAPPIPTQDVLVASGDLDIGQRLSHETVRWQAWPENMVNAGYITRSAQPDAEQALEGSVLRNHVSSGEPILKAKLVPQNSGFLSAILQSGKRAVAVPISAENTAGGFILPNDRVDVLHTFEEPSQNRSEQVTRTILKNVVVLAIDQHIDEAAYGEKGKDDKAKAATIGKTATLEVDPSQAEILAAAEAKGRISLALRSSADNGAVEAVAPPEVTEPVKPQPAALTVHIIRGGKSETVKMQ